MKKRSKIAAGAGAALAVVGAGGCRGRRPADAEGGEPGNRERRRQAARRRPRQAERRARAGAEEPDRRRGEGRPAVEGAGRRDEAPHHLGRVPALHRPRLRTRRRASSRLRWSCGAAHLNAAAAFLGLTEAQLDEALDGGKSLAQIAKDKGKSADELVDALVAATTKRLDQAVADGRMTKAQRDMVVADLKERTTAIVNGTTPAEAASASAATTATASSRVGLARRASDRRPIDGVTR